MTFCNNLWGLLGAFFQFQTLSQRTAGLCCLWRLNFERINLLLRPWIEEVPRCSQICSLFELVIRRHIIVVVLCRKIRTWINIHRHYGNQINQSLVSFINFYPFCFYWGHLQCTTVHNTQYCVLCRWFHSWILIYLFIFCYRYFY